MLIMLGKVTLHACIVYALGLVGLEPMDTATGKPLFCSLRVTGSPPTLIYLSIVQ